MDSPSKTLETDNITIIKKKIVAFDKLLKHKEKIESKCEELISSGANKDSEISRLSREIENLKQELENKTAKCSRLETENQKKSQQIGQLDIALGKKHCDFINQEIELNKLRREIEDYKTEREKFDDKLKNNTEVKRIREEYEDEKWKHLATISSLTQSNASLKEMMQETNALAQALQTDVKELEKYKQEALLGRSEGGKKDRLIVTLTRKLEKLRQGGQLAGRKGFNDSASEFDIPESLSGAAGGGVATPPPPPTQRRFVIFHAKRQSSQRMKAAARVKFLKLGPVELGDLLPWLVLRPPRISDAVSKAGQQPDGASAELSQLSCTSGEEELQKGGKRKRNEDTPTTPKKRQRGPVTPVSSSCEELESPVSSSTPHRDNDGGDQGAQVQKPPPTSSKDSGEQSPRGKAKNSKRIPVEEKSGSGKADLLGSSYIESDQNNGRTDKFFNPNPVRVRQAHRGLMTLPVMATSDNRVAKGASSATESEKENLTSSSRKSTGQGPIAVTSELSARILPLTDSSSTISARKKILQEGFTIEVGILHVFLSHGIGRYGIVQ